MDCPVFTHTHTHTHTHTAADLKNPPGSIHPGEPVGEKAGCSLTLSDDDFVRLVTGKLNPQQVGRERGRGKGGEKRRVRVEGRRGKERGKEGTGTNVKTELGRLSDTDHVSPHPGIL